MHAPFTFCFFLTPNSCDTSFVTPLFFSHIVTDCHNNHVTKIGKKQIHALFTFCFFLTPNSCDTSFVTPLFFTNCHRLSQQSCHKNALQKETSTLKRINVEEEKNKSHMLTYQSQCSSLFQNLNCERGKRGTGFSLPSLPLKK